MTQHPADEDPWEPDGPFFVVMGGSPRGWRNLARKAGEDHLIDWDTAPKPRLRWFVFRRRFRARQQSYQEELDAWYIRARREAGLPRVPTESDVERLSRERYRDPDPEMDAALQRLRQVLDGMPVRRCGWHHENGTIHVRIRPYRKRYVEPIRAACLPFPSAVTPSPRDE